MKIRARYNYDVRAVSRASAVKTGTECRVKQSFKEECDINTLVKRFGLTGHIPKDVRMPVHADFSNITDYQSLLNVKRAADEAFMAMPAEIRDRFANDPARLVRFCSEVDEKGNYVNLAEMRRLGLANPEKVAPPPPPPMKVEVVNPPANA